MRAYQDIVLWESIPFSQWTDWHWQLKNSITSLAQLEQVVDLTEEERSGVQLATKYLKMRISPHIATLMDPCNSQVPLRRQFIPSSYELESIDNDILFADVNADDHYSPVKGLVHRYPSKVLIFPSNYCGAYCRYCFRRKLIRDVEETLTKEELLSIFEYILRTPQIEEVILSGGDPLVISDEKLDFILSSLKAIPHVQILRIHTRLPVTIPYRITPELISILSKYKPIYMVLHIDTTSEISNPMREAISNLVENGIPCLASCPLLKGINDDEESLRSLWTELVKMRIKPYYLFHSDPVKGLKHFLVSVDRGLKMVHNLYDRMSGLAMPLYCFNVPGGGGHVLLSPNYVQKVGANQYVITNFEGQRMEYTDEGQ